jgi:hypothetical protein
MNVNDLLTLTRLPIHFWNEVNGEPDFRDNPGKQLQSWIVANCLDLEEAEVPEVLERVVAECERCFDDHKSIIDWIDVQHAKFETTLMANAHLSGVSDLAMRLSSFQRQAGVIRSNIEFLSSRITDDYFPSPDDATFVVTMQGLIDQRLNITDFQERLAKALGGDSAA